MTKIMLIRHAEPVVAKHTPARNWVLSDAGKTAAAALGTRLKGLGLVKLASSSEPKALQTAQIIADQLDISVEVDPREHERAAVGFLNRTDFETRIAAFLATPAISPSVKSRRIPCMLASPRRLTTQRPRMAA